MKTIGVHKTFSNLIFLLLLQTQLQDLDNPLSRRVRGVIKKIREDRHRHMKVQQSTRIPKSWNNMLFLCIPIPHLNKSSNYSGS